MGSLRHPRSFVCTIVYSRLSFAAPSSHVQLLQDVGVRQHPAALAGALRRLHALRLRAVVPLHATQQAPSLVNPCFHAGGHLSPAAASDFA